MGEQVNEKQMQIAGYLIRVLTRYHNNAKCKAKAPQIIIGIRNKGHAIGGDGSELRDIIGIIRRSGICHPGFILSDSGGYWYSEDLEEFKRVSESSINRAKEIMRNTTELRKLIRHMEAEKNKLL